MSVEFFNPESAFGTLTGWEVQSENPNTTATRAQQLGSDGDEIANKLHDHKVTTSCVYTLKTASSCKIPKFGEILNGWHCDTVSIAFTNTGFVQMTVTGHKHQIGDTLDSHPACRTYTGSLTTIASNFGCPSTLVGLQIPSGSGVRSYTWSLQGNHQDELGSDGEFLAAENYDGNETADCELCNSGTISAATGWDITTASNSMGNTQVETASATAEKHLAHDSVSA